jgi:hypothetical protein
VETICGVAGILEPDIVIFASKFSWEVLGGPLTGSFGRARVNFVSHPADPFYWNRKGYSHGREKFIGLLRSEFLQDETTRGSAL